MALTTLPLRLVKTWQTTRPKYGLRPAALVLACLSFPLIAGCGDVIDDGEALAKATGNGSKSAAISLSPIKLSFIGTEGGSNPPGQAIAISNAGTGKLSWRVSTDASWLSLSSASGTGAGSFTAMAIVPGLAAGTYSGNVTVTATGAANTPQTIPVSLTISVQPSPEMSSLSTISLSPALLALSATQGGSNPSGAVAVSNTGTGTLSWTASTNASWLSVSQGSGIAPSSFVALANITGMAAGTYSANITLSATGATNAPLSVPVTLTVSASQPVATSALLSWDPNPDSTVVGFFVHYGTQSPNSSGSCAYAQGTYFPLSSMTVSSPAATIANLATGTMYYFAVSSYNGRVESTCSNEVPKAT
jgi:hypothetical protein